MYYMSNVIASVTIALVTLVAVSLFLSDELKEQLFAGVFTSLNVAIFVGLVGAIILFVIIAKGGFPFVRNWGTKIMMHDVRYIGYDLIKSTFTYSFSYGGTERSWKDKAAVLSPDSKDLKRPVKPLNRVYAFLSYRSNFLNYKRGLRNKRTKLGVYTNNRADEKFIYSEGWAPYVDTNLRREVYNAIAAEKEFLKTNPSDPNWTYPPATYFFALNDYTTTSYERVLAYLEHGLNPYDAERGKIVSLDTMSELQGLPMDYMIKFA